MSNHCRADGLKLLAMQSVRTASICCGLKYNEASKSDFVLHVTP